MGRSVFDHTQKSKTPKPHTSPSAYYRGRLDCDTSAAETYTAGDMFAFYKNSNDPREFNQLIMYTYEQLKEKFSDRAALGTSLAEGRESVNMIVSRANQVRSFFKSIKAGDFQTVERLARQAQARKSRARARNQSTAEDMFRDAVKGGSRNLLEYQWGWAPLVGDIQDGLKVMTGNFEPMPIKGRKSGPLHRKMLKDYSQYDNWSGGYFVERLFITFYNRVEQGCEIWIDNPNLWLANQLGLVNPIQSGMEVIPFFFMADWFLNLSQVAGALTDFAGLSVKNGYTTKSTQILRVDSHRANPYWDGDRDIVGAGFEMDRSVGVLLPQLGVRLWKPFGVQRSINALALMTQLFIGDSTPPITKYGKYLR